MDDPFLLAMVSDWTEWSRPVSVLRNISLPKRLRPSECLVIQGVRRCGKSTLFRQLVSHYHLQPEHCAFLNFEDPRLSGELHFHLLERLVQVVGNRHPDAPLLYFFLDEIQGVEGWERWLRSQLDRPGRHVFVITGSNASLLSGELGSVLTGRHLTVELFPFDYAEYRSLFPKAGVQQYLRDGGFPGTLLNEDGEQLRRQYFQDIVERDIRERVGARSVRPLLQVLQMVYESAGSELSLRRIASAAGVAVETASSYLEAAEAAYLVFGVPFFAHSERKSAAYHRKYYPIDSGLRRVVVTPGGADLGKALECATFIALRRQYRDISYWRGKGEIDFVIREGQRITPVQVTLETPQPRHQRALEDFWEQFPMATEALHVDVHNFEHLADLSQNRG